MASNLLCAVMIWLCFASIGAHPGIAACVGISCVTAIANAVPLLPGQLGVFESAFVLGAKQLGVESGTALAVALLYHATHLAPAVLGAAVATLRWRSSTAPRTPPTQIVRGFAEPAHASWRRPPIVDH